jgi:hypothetical protein
LPGGENGLRLSDLDVEHISMVGRKWIEGDLNEEWKYGRWREVDQMRAMRLIFGEM